jgi:sialidase-1
MAARGTMFVLMLLLALFTVVPCDAAVGETPWPPAGDLAWDGVYDGTAAPLDSLPSWRESSGANTEATLEGDGLRIIDSSSQGGCLHCYIFAWRAMPEEGAVVEASIKLIDNNSRSGAFIGGADGVHESSVTLYPDRIGVCLDGDEELTHAMDTTNGFHVYRLAMRGEDLYVWVDGQLVMDGKGKYTRPAHNGRNRVIFGSCSSAAVSEAVYASVRFATLGELPPLPPRIAGAEDVVVYKKQGVYACFPSLIQLDDGTLFSSFGTRTRRSHIDNTGGSARRISKDGGRTWEPFEGAWPITSFARCEDGSLVNASAYGWRNVPEERRSEFADQGITVRDVRDGVVAYLQGARVRRSTDEGKTWQTEELQLPAHKSLMTFNTGSSCKLSNGTRLVAVYGSLQEDTLRRAFVLRSADDGKTWWFLPLAADPEGQVNLNETAIAENADGEVIAMIRAEPPEGGYMFTSVSTDSGITWSPAQRAGMWGYPGHLLLLSDGRMLCTYGYRRDDMGVRAVISDDGGHTWNTDEVIILRNDAAPYGSDLGYPISVEIEPGQIFTIYYFTLDDGITHIAGTHWQVPPANK